MCRVFAVRVDFTMRCWLRGGGERGRYAALLRASGPVVGGPGRRGWREELLLRRWPLFPFDAAGGVGQLFPSP